jgi:cation diffusion facilitator CzcD-associated flavoprotein CzcO
MIRKGVQKATESTLVDVDGEERTYDVIICATGFDTSYAPRFPVLGEGGQSLADRWKKFPVSYMSMAVDGFPNLFIINGPNSAVGTGDLV